MDRSIHEGNIRTFISKVQCLPFLSSNSIGSILLTSAKIIELGTGSETETRFSYYLHKQQAWLIFQNGCHD